ncbi:MAG: hypothetical protein ACK4VN_02280 [Bacteroidales bacterium]
MQKARKFGTFGGVFTPALLTILSVIMYLRLGWIVGQVGLYYTIGIILVANIIAITTGLSLSSIATDKRVKAGGVYYMLSRSLGLSIGGAIGATIYLAFGLSIALNIVGFAESFLSVDSVSNFLGMHPGAASYRIIGAAVLLLLATIAFISTSLAIKTQYLVLTAIVLSLISIIAGLILRTEFHPVSPVMFPTESAPSLAVMFAVFFPAATGFMQGASMSGDLKDPRRSIPKGTMLAIFTGLFINLALAVGFGLFVDRDLLLSDTAFLQKIAMVPPLVVVGIWGATLSTALGAMLGGPRVVQAMAADRLAPGFLAKGYGVNNEPHRAILLTFFIALSAILLGDLNTIARIATMFFITAYGFINLAYALESWASSDFRPTFRIPRWVGWIGFGASFLVMMQIDPIAMLVAFLLLWMVWFIMRKREKKFDPGDVWQSVWSSVVRHSLHKMDTQAIEERNWKPNIMLFSGNPQTRPHLTELGKALIANHGLLTIINFKVFPQGQKPLSRFRQTRQTEESLADKGIFTREYYCSDIYQGIENLAETYGFAGVEPNTVLLGWARQTSDPVRFAKLLNHIIALDLNLLLMDYDSQRGFGKRRMIDIWWRGSGNNGNLAINLVKFLWLSEEWKDSKTRLMIENPINDERETIYNFAREVLDNLRVNAEIMIINNEIEKKPFYDIIRAESADSDIIFLGLPDIEEGQEADFVEQTHALCSDLGTVVLIKASTQFKRLNIGLRQKPHDRLAQFPESSPVRIQHIRWPKDEQRAAFAKGLYAQTSDLIHEMRNQAFGKMLYQFADILANARNRVNATFGIIQKKMEEQPSQMMQIMFKLTGNSFSRYEQILLNLRDPLLADQQKNLELYFSAFTEKSQKLLQSIPEKITLDLNPEYLQPEPGDMLSLKWYKWRKRLQSRSHPRQNISARKLAESQYPQTFHAIKEKLWHKLSALSMQYVIEQQKAFKQFRDSLHILETAMEQNLYTPELLQEERAKVEAVFASLRSFLHEAEKEFFQLAEEENNHAIQNICDALGEVHPDSGLKKTGIKKFRKARLRSIEDYPEVWRRNLSMQINFNLLELTLSSVDYKMWRILARTTFQLQDFIRNPQGHTLQINPESIIAFTQDAMARSDRQESIAQPDFKTLPTDDLYQRVKDIEDDTLEKINQSLSRIPSHARLPRKLIAADLISLTASELETEKFEVSKLINFIIQNDLISPLQKQMQQYSRELHTLELEILEIARLIRITLTGDKEDVVHIPDKYFFAEQNERAQMALQRMQDLAISIEDRLRNLFNKTSAQLSPPVFLKTAENMRLYSKTREKSTRKQGLLKRRVDLWRDRLRRLLVKIWFDRSKRLVYAHGLRISEKDDFLPVSQLHALNEAVSVKNPILDQIPPYYQQLFLRKNNYFMDFWHGKDRDLEEAQKIIRRHERGYSGALLIRGEHNTGKTFMANYICHRFLAHRPVFVVQPPFAGSAHAADFLKALQKATEKPLGVQKLMKSLPERSVIVIEDLELWWEKNPEGLKVLQLICGLIEKYGSRTLFIINVNLHAFNSISKFKRLDPWLLGSVTCHPFHAEELKTILLQRHGSGNLKFVFNGKRENEMRSWDHARLFNTYFNYTRGNIGLALQTWMSSIDQVKNNVLYITQPKRPDLAAFNKLNSETLIFLVQFILHKRLNLEKIQRLMLFSPEQAREKIMQLKRASLVTEPNPGVYMLNPNLHPFIREYLLEKELL